VPLLDQVIEKYPKAVRVVFKNFPLKGHKYAREAALAALAAGAQGKFWEFHDLLFENVRRLSTRKFREIARELGLDMARFEKDMNDPRLAAAVRRDRSDGLRAGVRGTPTVFINGKRLHKRNLSGFQARIEKELYRARPGTR